MMNKIKILPPEIYNRISAGEVIERPANVVKELIENSIDASANELIIEFFSAGKKIIRVTDNGIGMNKEELLTAIKPHATSKIYRFEDIYNLKTLGFRGEALSSIVSVAKVRITSKPADSNVGYELIVHGGEIISITECGCNNGTSVEIKDIFYNTPARLKFLKSDYTEKMHIIRTVEEYCIPFKNISVKLFSDNELIFSTNSTEDLQKRLTEILGKNILKGLIYFNHKDSDKLSIYGYISKLDFSQVNKSLQLFFVNNRPITSRIISQSLYDAYRESLPPGRHPVGIIFIEVDPQEIDVNVHPTKRMIKFKSESYIYELLRDIIRTQVKKFATRQTQLWYEIKKEDLPEQEIKLSTFPVPKNVVTEELPFSEKEKKVSIEKLGIESYIYLGQLHKTYLLLETPAGLTAIDQHAASERILYEKFLNTKSVGIQKLLIPINIEMKHSEFELIKPFLETINSIGFEFVITGKNSLGIYGLPSILNVNDCNDFIKRFIENLLLELKEQKINISPKERIVRSACRAAIKSQDILTLKDVEKLISDLSQCEQPFTCPHGRPTILNISISDFEKMFLRK